jgi:DNA end-binding protein Ku
VDVRPQELTMAMSLIDSMTDDFDPSQFGDEYREALEAVIEAKVEGREVVAPVEPKSTGEVVDLMAALQASVENARKGRPAAASKPAKKSAKAAGKKASAAKRAPAKKVAAKAQTGKTRAKKTA